MPMISHLHVLAALRAMSPDERRRVEALVAQPKSAPSAAAPVQHQVYSAHPEPGRRAFRKVGERWIECEPDVTPLVRRRPVEVEGSQPWNGSYNPVGRWM